MNWRDLAWPQDSDHGSEHPSRIDLEAIEREDGVEAEPHREPVVATPMGAPPLALSVDSPRSKVISGQAALHRSYRAPRRSVPRLPLLVDTTASRAVVSAIVVLLAMTADERRRLVWRIPNITVSAIEECPLSWYWDIRAGSLFSTESASWKSVSDQVLGHEGRIHHDYGRGHSGGGRGAPAG